MTITYAPSVKALCDAMVVSREKLSATMRQVTDPSPRAVGTWTIGKTEQHVSSSAEYFLILLAGASLALAAVTMSFHPIYLVAVLINIAVLIGVTGHLPLTESVLPSVEAPSMNQTRSQT